MEVDWFSRQGNERKSNNDAAVIAMNEGYCIAVLTDASERGNGSSLARYWSETVVSTLHMADGPIQELGVIDILKELHRTLKYRFVLELASYCLLIIDHKLKLATSYHVGDCIAIHHCHHDGSTQLTPPHRLSEETSLQSGQSLANGHTLTRSLKAKRFLAPDIKQCSFQSSDHETTKFTLSSDGFWYEHLMEQTEIDKLADDASLLSIVLANGETSISQQADNNPLIIL
ncbi:hypothetical protein [Oceanospirillum sediminis]|uniref:PPM-type phosphatase domain-containing protein n=1 Tax=Oceanospirillum sediminis TaxID=2760088 RepID=A0A839IST8_9GAMM|nr:hypothetical protein [Oceanospirillum sediminis]MBB1487539.1 hypothetical protein [Oceanospirillum sediminis]